MIRLVPALAVLLGLAARSAAVAIIPVPSAPYDYSGGLAPLPNYGFGILKLADFSYKLTDGRYGDLNPGVNLASADPSNWVEYGGTTEMTFHFPTSVRIQNILLSLANWNDAAIYLPDVVKVNGGFVTYGGTFPNLNRAFVSLDGDWTGTDLVLRLQYTGNTYMFMDEVSFYSAPGEGLAPVPEPSAYALLAGAAALTLVVGRRRRA